MPSTFGPVRHVLIALPALVMLSLRSGRAVSPVSVILALPFAIRLPVARAGPRDRALVMAVTVPVTGGGTGRVGRRDGRADVLVRGGWPPLGHRSGRGRLLAGTCGRPSGGRGGGVTASAAAAVRRRQRGRGGDRARGGRESDDAGQHDDHDGGHRRAGVGEDR